jgi:hypothetical protein
MPYSLSEEQIDFILSDIKARGIEIEKLQINLLDHVCCLLEQRMKNGDDFKRVYEEIIKEFHDSNLKEIEKETKGLVKNKHFYKIKSFIYVIFVISIGYNIYAGTKYTVRYFDQKKFINEYFLLQEATLTEGYDLLIKKLRNEVHLPSIKEHICVCFLSSPMSSKEFEMFGLDTTETNGYRSNIEKRYKELDSLANIYTQVTFVVAFQTSEKDIDNFITDQKTKTRSIIYLTELNKLLSGYMNSKKINGINLPSVFIFDRTGKIEYDCKFPTEAVYFLSLYLKKLRK